MANERASLSQDLTRALSLTFRPGRVAVMALGLLIGVAAAMAFYWIGGLIKPQAIRWLAWIIQRIGAVIFAYVVLASMGSAVSMAHAESTGGRVGVPAGWALIARNVGAVATGTIKPIIIFVASLAIIWGAGALGAIPKVGPILWAIISIVAVAAGLLAVLVVIKLFLVSFLFPSVLSVAKQKGVASYRESGRLIKGHAAHVLGRIAVAVLICLVFYKVIVAGFAFTARQTANVMGDNAATLRGWEGLLKNVVGIPGVAGTAPEGLGVEDPFWPFRRLTILRPTGTRFAGALIFSIVLIVISTIILSVPLIFFALSGYYAYMSFKDAPELPLKVKADWSEIKKTAKEIAGKRKGETEEKAGEA